MNKKIMAVISALVLVGSCIGGYIAFMTILETKFAPYALANEVRLQGVRLEQKIVQDNITFTQRQMQSIEIRCQTTDPLKMPVEAQQHYYRLQRDLQKFNQELQRLSK